MSLRRLVLPACLVAFAACNNGSTASALVRLDPEAAGTNCPHGGIQVSTGLDKNNDGSLGDDEVTASRSVCNGADGTDGTPGPAGDAGVNGLSLVTAEPAGPNCRYGGVRVDVGVDLDGDGMLAATEITDTRYICDQASVDGIWFGDFTISTAADIAALSGIQHITGDLTIDSVDAAELELPDLVSIGGWLSAASGGGLVQVGKGIDGLQRIRLPALTHVGTVDLWYLPALTTLSLPKLTRSGDFTLYGNDLLTTLELPVFARAEWVRVSNNGALTGLALPELAYARRLEVSSNGLLATLSAPKLDTVAEYLSITNNAALSECTAWRIVSALAAEPDFGFDVSGNDTTTACTAADVCRVVSVSGVGGTLYECRQQLDFTGAQALCASIGTGSALAWVTSDAEWQALSAAAAAGTVSGGWIGYSDATTEGAWVAVGGFTGYDPTARTDFWAMGEPNGGTAENASELLGDGHVNDAAATATLPFLCRAP